MTHRASQMLSRHLPSRIAPLLDQFRAPSNPQQSRLRADLRQRLAGKPAQDEHLPPLQPRLVVPMVEKTPEQTEYDLYFDQAQFLARQENWAELGRLIRSFDSARSSTAGGLPVAEILALGARADAVSAAIEAVGNYDYEGARLPLLALEDVFDELSLDHGVALVVAMAHIDIGWAWRGEGWTNELPPEHRAAFHAHFKIAARIIDRFDAFELDAPSLAAARCALLAAENAPRSRVCDDYEDLIDMDPASPRHMRAMGNHLLPRWFGTYTALDYEARRVAARTSDIWGNGGYTWVYFDALTVDPKAFNSLDVDLFIAGLKDILDRLPTQHYANLLAAFTGQTMSGCFEPGSAQDRISKCFDWIAREHLTEIHPMVWMSLPTAVGLINDETKLPDQHRLGRVRALSTLAQHFAPQIEKGFRVVFDADGFRLDSAH